MADIMPFRGIRYRAGAVDNDLAAVVAPPYDVISPDMQAALYAQHPSNVVRLILGREPDRHAEAARLFREWERRGILMSDFRPSVYVYRQRFADPLTGKTLPERLGLVCLLKLEDYASGKVLPHENTLTAAKADRLELLRASHAQFESIYGLYSDPDCAVQSFLKEYDDRQPVIEEIDGVIGSTHAVEQISDPDALMVLRELLRDKPIFIADGHHRYETALNYRREARAAQPDLPPETPIAADYILITLTAFEDEGLLVLPTHRLVRGVDARKVAALPQMLAAQFEIAPVPPDSLSAAIEEKAAQGRKAFGIVLPQGKAYLATLKFPATELPGLISGPGSDALKRLDVSLLHHLVLDQALGIAANTLATSDQVSYTRDAAEAVSRVDSGEFQAAFILGRPSVQDVRDVSVAGDKMPQKSTFFYPKLLSGLLMRDLALDNLTEIMVPDVD